MKVGTSLRNGIFRNDGNYRDPQRFVLLPAEGLWPSEGRTSHFTSDLFSSLATGAEREAPIGISPTNELRTDIDEVSDRGLILAVGVITPPQTEIARGAYRGLGPTLVELDAEALLALRRLPFWVRVIPEEPIFLMTSLPGRIPTPAPTGSVPVTIEVRDVRGNAIEDAEVQAFTDFQLALGDKGVTDSAGSTTLYLGGPQPVIDRLYVQADRATYRGHYATSVTVGASSHHVVVLDDVDLSIIDCLRFRYSPSAGDGTDVRIGLIDTGVDQAHPDLSIAGGRNTVLGESPYAYGDNGTTGHGTHLAGIIAANPSNANQLMGLASSAELYSYRVFGHGQTRADGAFAILEAVIRALGDDSCHLLNMSFGIPEPNAIWTEVDKYIWEHGALAFAAAGNTNRGAVTLPATLPHVAAVGAIGRKHTYPPRSLEEADELGAFGHDSDDYTAAFSPDSFDVQLAAPGVGVMSTLPGGGYGPWSGTSQASAAAIGRAAALLSGSSWVSSAADSKRAAGLWNTLFSRLAPLGMGLNLEGGGVLQ
jgi:subtilisin